MTRDEMSKLADPETFEPFVIVTGSGSRFPVNHPDFIDIPPLPEEGAEDETWPSYVTVYETKSSVARFIVLSNIQQIEFKRRPSGGE
jgi:hypothetical protein